MQRSSSSITSKATIRAVLFVSIFSFLYFLFVLYIATDVYKVPFIGALYELLWMPMLILLVALPIVSLIQVIKGDKSKKRLTVFSLLTSLATILLIVMRYA